MTYKGSVYVRTYKSSSHMYGRRKLLVENTKNIGISGARKDVNDRHEIRRFTEVYMQREQDGIIKINVRTHS